MAPVTVKKIIVNMYLNKLEEELAKLNNEIKNIDIIDKKNIQQLSTKSEKITAILNYYKSVENNFSYALIDQIRTISKLNILRPINQYDIVNRTKCTEGEMIQIDKAIAKKFIGVDFIEFEKWYDQQKNIN